VEEPVVSLPGALVRRQLLAGDREVPGQVVGRYRLGQRFRRKRVGGYLGEPPVAAAVIAVAVRVDDEDGLVGDLLRLLRLLRLAGRWTW